MRDEGSVEVTSTLVRVLGAAACSEAVCSCERAARTKETYVSQRGVTNNGALVWYVDYRLSVGQESKNTQMRGEMERRREVGHGCLAFDEARRGGIHMQG